MNNSNVGGQQQRPQQQSGQFGTGQQQQTGQMTNITGMQMPGGQIRYQINSQPQPGMVHVVQNVGMPVGNVQMQSQQQQNTNQPQQYQQVNMILSNQTVMRPNQTSQPQQQQTVNVAFTPQFQQGQQFYIQQQPAQMQPISVPSGGPPRIYHLQTTPNGPQQVFVGQPQNIRPQTFNFPSQSLQQRPIGSSGPPTRLVTINQQQSGGNTNVNRPVYQPMPPQSFSIPSAQSQQPHQQTKLTDTSARFSASSNASHSSTVPNPSFSSQSSGASSSQPTGSQPWIEDSKEVLTKKRLEDLVKEVDQYEVLDEDVKDSLLQLSDDFIESLVRDACQIAKHRKSKTLDVKDVQLCLERNWNMWIPGFGSDDLKPYKKAPVTDAHKQRMALIRKNLKKSS